MIEKFYIVTREDLEPGLQLSQAVHSAMGFTVMFGISNPNITVICLSVKNEKSLKEIIRKLEMCDMRFFSFREPDLRNEITSVSFLGCDPSFTRRFKPSFSSSRNSIGRVADFKSEG